MSRWPMTLLVLSAASIGLVACGGGAAQDDASVDTILADTFGKGKEVKSGRVDASMKLDAKGLAQLAGPIGLRLSGPFQSQGSGQLPKFDFEATIDAGQQLKVGAVSTGEKGYLELQGQPYVLSDSMFKQFKDGYAQQAKCNEQQGKGTGGSFAALGVNPRTWLRDAEKAGTEQVGGTDTTHITGTIDVPKFLDDVNRILARASGQQSSDPCADGTSSSNGKQQDSRQLTAQQKQTIAGAIKSAKVDIWTGADDRTMRRMNIAVAFDVPKGSQSKLGGMTSGNLSLDLTISDLNAGQTIKEPSGAKPFDDLVKSLSGAGLTGASSSGSGGGSTGTGTTGGSAYERCMAQAGSDVKKLQACKDLVGQ